MFFGVVGPGKTNDNVAFPRCVDLYTTIVALPSGLYFLVDAAYDLCETLLVPFTGSQRANSDNDAFNFYLSQLQIRIELAFGRLLCKFCILKCKPECKLATSSKILMAFAKLHNYVIDYQLMEKDNDDNDVMDDDDSDELHCIQLDGAPLGL